ncbi:MAG: hypothetical protein RJA34_1991 [Pseudomonadota bacterium]|jgi:hypothetical protein
MALVSRVTVDCPQCGLRDGFGKVEVFSGSYVFLGCKKCHYSERIQLPPLRKKILYLDQYFFSHTFRGKLPEYLKAAELIEKASSMQLLVAPYSSIHEDETHLWEKRDELFKFIKATSRGHTFKSEFEVEQTQVWKAFRAWMNKVSPDYLVEEKDALRGDIHQWDGYMRIEVGRYMGNIELMRRLKDQSVEGLVDLFDGWRKSNSTFEEDLAQEYASVPKGYFDSYFDYVGRIVSGDVEAFLTSPMRSMMVESMLRMVPKEVPEEGRLRVCAEFMMQSEHFRSIPSHYLAARVYATVKDMVKRGAYTNREKALRIFNGFFYDVKHLSTYAPYCDAFLLDKRMADIVSKPSVGIEQKYGTKIFSENNWDELIAWLEVLPKSMSEEHRAGLIAAYH